MDYVLLLFVFSVVMGISTFRNWQTLYVSKPVVLSVYFLFAFLLVAYLFPAVAVNVLVLPHLLIFAIAYVCAFSVYALTRYFYRPPTALIERHGAKNVFIRLEYPFLLAKGSEVAFQQICFVTFVLLLASDGVPFLFVTVLSACALLVVHAPLVITHGWRWGSLYVLGALVFGLFSPYLILNVPNGIAYAFAVHFLAYGIAGALVWWADSKKTT